MKMFFSTLQWSLIPSDPESFSPQFQDFFRYTVVFPSMQMPSYPGTILSFAPLLPWRLGSDRGGLPLNPKKSSSASRLVHRSGPRSSVLTLFVLVDQAKSGFSPPPVVTWPRCFRRVPSPQPDVGNHTRRF